MSRWIQVESREEELLRSGLELSVHLEGCAWEISGSSFVVLRNLQWRILKKLNALLFALKVKLTLSNSGEYRPEWWFMSNGWGGWGFGKYDHHTAPGPGEAKLAKMAAVSEGTKVCVPNLHLRKCFSLMFIACKYCLDKNIIRRRLWWNAVWQFIRILASSSNAWIWWSFTKLLHYNCLIYFL